MDNKDELKNKLKSKISDKNLSRSSKFKRETLIDKNFKKLGIDKQKFQDDLESVKKQGGFSDEQMQKLFSSIGNIGK
jgi:hypothetical protein